MIELIQTDRPSKDIVIHWFHTQKDLGGDDGDQVFGVFLKTGEEPKIVDELCADVHVNVFLKQDLLELIP